MARIATIAWTDSAGASQNVAFSSFADGDIRNFVDFIPSGNIQDIRRFNTPGVDGNFLIRAGFRGAQLEVNVRYKDTLANCTAAWKADREAFAKYSTAINDGQSYFTRCTLRNNSATRSSGEKASGSSGKAFFDVQYIFDIEEL